MNDTDYLCGLLLDRIKHLNKMQRFYRSQPGEYEGVMSSERILLCEKEVLRCERLLEQLQGVRQAA